MQRRRPCNLWVFKEGDVVLCTRSNSVLFPTFLQVSGVHNTHSSLCRTHRRSISMASCREHIDVQDISAPKRQQRTSMCAEHLPYPLLTPLWPNHTRAFSTGTGGCPRPHVVWGHAVGLRHICKAAGALGVDGSSRSEGRCERTFRNVLRVKSLGTIVCRQELDLTCNVRTRRVAPVGGCVQCRVVAAGAGEQHRRGA